MRRCSFSAGYKYDDHKKVIIKFIRVRNDPLTLKKTDAGGNAVTGGASAKQRAAERSYDNAPASCLPPLTRRLNGNGRRITAAIS